MHIMAKLGTMRKPQDFIVYPARSDGRMTIQSDTRICEFDPATGQGMLSKAGRPYFIDLAKVRGATAIVVPQDIIDAAKAAQPKSGDAIGPGVTLA